MSYILAKNYLVVYLFCLHYKSNQCYTFKVPIITLLEAQKNNKERVSVYVDGTFFCGITLDEIVRNRISAGMNVSEADLKELQKSSSENDLYNKAFAYILTTPRTIQQIRQYLFKKEPSRESRDKVIERLVAANLVNDEDYATQYAESKCKKISNRAIKIKLMERGVSAAFAEKAIAKLDDKRQKELADVVAEKYMRSKEVNTKNILKLHRYLVTKGFDYDTVNDIVNHYKGG